MLRPTWYLTDGDLLTDHHNPAPPDLRSGVAALAGEHSGPGRAPDMATVRLASCTEFATGTHLGAARDRAAQR
ncbi:hypothetical protein ABZ807_30895 [Micromonospora sp. NPDC047548]|uniref:hypothetical protein n=1 Tax=Micromonospora sp. NPDC047548 TaxID=3155624 RepID=UPI0033FD403E